MVMKELRQERNWSQEQLADLSGLSLRTIQRIESGDRLSPDSLATIACAFEIEVVALERELAMDKISTEWRKRPAWVRGLFLGSSHIQMDKKQHKKVEVAAAIAGIGFIAAGIYSAMENFVPTTAVILFLVSGSLLVLGAYLMSTIAHIGDQHTVWPWLTSNSDGQRD